MEKIKISFITTVFNEEKTITQFLESLFTQSELPDEIIIVDAKSQDKTIEKISEFPICTYSKKLKIKLIAKNGNRSVGRNTAIKAAAGDIIVCSDVGCILDKDFIKNITSPFTNRAIDVVSGFYKPVATNIFEKCLATYTSVMPDKIDKENFLPSSRSVAFKKSAWEKINGYPEALDTCEDLVFDKKLKKSGAMFVFAESAYVYWPQRKNLWLAAKQFFSYAKGDGKALFFRKQTPFLFARYIFAFSLLSIGSLFHKLSVVLPILAAGFLVYVMWSILKNYRYVKSYKAFFYLPMLQITADICVLLGTSIGLLETGFKRLFILAKENKAITALALLYSGIALSQLSWGLPNNNHPFSYHMDEWAQAFSLRSTFAHGTPHLHGGGNGTVFFYIVSGLLYLPFVLLHISNPFVIKSSLANFDLQQRMFELLRLQSIFQAVLSIVLISFLAKKYLKINPIVPALFLTISPLIFVLTIFYRYDTPVMLWIIFTILFSFIYIKKPTSKNFYLLGVITALTITIKVSAIPLVGMYIFLFVLLNWPNFKKGITLIKGLVLIAITFVITGIPDAFISFNKFTQWLYLSTDQSFKTTDITVSLPFYPFTYLKMYPAEFGHVFYFLFVVTIIWYGFICIKSLLQKKLLLSKEELTLFVGFLCFLLSIISLGTRMSANRLMVFLPFFALLTPLVLFKIYFWLGKNWRFITKLVFIGLVTFQIIESLSWVPSRWFRDGREVASYWMKNNIPKGETVALEPIPIFQDIPDFTLKDFYTKEYFPTYKSYYTYEMITSTSTPSANYVVLTNVTPLVQYFKNSDKKLLTTKLSSFGYTKIATFTPNMYFYHLFNTDEVYYFSGLKATALEVTIYKKTNSK